MVMGRLAMYLCMCWVVLWVRTGGLHPMLTINGMWFQAAAEVSETWACCLPV
jgi:hypothetical protein